VIESWALLSQITLLLAAALVAGGVFARFKQSPLLGYIVAGMFIGGVGLVESAESLEVIAELGVSLLLFSLGLEFSWQRLRAFGVRSLVGAGIQIVATALLVSGFVYWLGLSVAESVAVGAALSLSSTAAVLRVLTELGETESLHGRNSIAILLVQDIAVVPLAVLIPMLHGGRSGSEIALDAGRVALFGGGLVVLLYVALSRVAVRALGALSRERTRELTVLLAVVVGLGSTWASHAAGLSPALGAFVAGVFLGGSSFGTQVRADVSSLRIVLLTLFFAAAGLVADPVWIANHALLVLGATSLLLIGKALVVVVALRVLGHPLGVALGTGLCLCQIGEFAFVLGGSALEHDVIAHETYMAIVSCAIVSLFVTPLLVTAAPRAAAWTESLLGSSATRGLTQHDSGPSPEVVIIGYGPAGQAVGRFLAERKVDALVLDVNPEARVTAERIGLIGQVGDALHVEVLEHAHVQTARWVVITLPAPSSALVVLANVRAMNPRACVIVRARLHLHRAEFLAAGAHVVVDEEVEVGRRLRSQMRAQLAQASRAS